MNRTKLFSLSALALIVVSVGAIAAMWSESLWINVTVSTGEVDVEWSAWNRSDNGPDPQAPGFDNSEGKDVAQCIVTPEIYDEEDQVIKLNVTITNAYPGYAPTLELLVDNVGTIPVKLYNYSVTAGGDYCGEISFNFLTPNSTQIHPGGNSTYEIQIVILQPAQYNSTYTFEISLTFAQWNEVTGP